MIVRRLGGVLEATHVRPRLILAPHPVDPSRRDGFWLVSGRLVDWGPLAEDQSQATERTLRALAGSSGPRGGAHIPPDEVDEVRIVGAYLASHPELPQLELEPPPGEAELERFLAEDSGERQPDHLGAGGLVTHRDG